MNNTKKLTEAAILSSLFVITAIIFIGTGFGYAIYLDFIVPVFFCIVCLKCDIKYTILSAITSLVIVGLVLGDIGTAIWASQSIILGIMCGYFISKSSTILDDIVYASIIGVVIMVLIDVYFSTLIGYSFIEEFQSMSNKFLYKEYIDVIFYMLIALFPMGTVFSIYILSLFVGKKLNILKDNSKKKMYIIGNFRSFGRFICCSKNVFYGAVIYITLIEIIKVSGFNIGSGHIKTIVIAVQYLCMYFVIRDCYSSVQNYLISKYKKISYARIMTLITILSLIFMFRITTVTLIILDIILNKRINIRVKQINIINSYANNLIQK